MRCREDMGRRRITALFTRAVLLCVLRLCAMQIPIPPGVKGFKAGQKMKYGEAGRIPVLWGRLVP